MKSSIQVTIFLAAACLSLAAQTRPFDQGKFKGRIAYSADGNHNDPDDWAASPVALAILAEARLKDRLVHFDYNCILPETNPEWEKIHAESVLGAAQRYGFDKAAFFDCRKKLEEAIASLAKAIDASTAEDPLYFVIAGPMEVPFRGIEKSDPAKRKHVYCISHSRWNDGYASNYKFAFTKRTVIEQDVHWVQIRDQNRLLSLSPYKRSATPEEFNAFFWMRDSRDSNVRFLWDRTLVSTRPDPSDAGMMYYLVTGDEDCDPSKLKTLIEDHRSPTPITVKKQLRIEAENFRNIDQFIVDDRKDKKVSHQLSVQLKGAANGRIQTHFDEPFASKKAKYDVVIRYLAGRPAGGFAFMVNGASRRSWKPNAGADWSTERIRDIDIQIGDELSVEAAGEGAKLDYVELQLKE